MTKPELNVRIGDDNWCVSRDGVVSRNGHPLRVTGDELRNGIVDTARRLLERWTLQPEAPAPDEPKTHDLKCWPEQFQLIWDGSKRFELRRNDRNYAVGDRLRLREWCPERGCYLGRVVLATNTHQRCLKLDGLDYVIMSIVPLEKTERPSPFVPQEIPWHQAQHIMLGGGECEAWSDGNWVRCAIRHANRCFHDGCGWTIDDNWFQWPGRRWRACEPLTQEGP